MIARAHLPGTFLFTGTSNRHRANSRLLMLLREVPRRRHCRRLDESGKSGSPYSNAGGKPWDLAHSATLTEFGPPFLNGLRRSVNHKVQGSNPWSGANFE
jgi:hypothetical protein